MRPAGLEPARSSWKVVAFRRGRAVAGWMLAAVLGGAALAAEPPSSARPVAAAAAADADAVDVARDVAPILRDRCVRCHTPQHRSGDVSLATAADLRGLQFVDPAAPDQSYLLELVAPRGDKPPLMPKEGRPLDDAQRATLRAWIAAGAPWPEGLVVEEKPKAGADFWAFQPLANVVPPTIPPEEATQHGVDWTAHPLDRFVLAKLLKAGLRPSPPADRRTLLTRLTYDLTGLPPTPEELAAFEADDAPDAYARAVDRLLASPEYGERWGRHWLDVVRYGESRGFERNQIIDNLWPFRDYVIRALNEDRPWDQVIREHLAGDILGRDRPEIEVASAFLVAGPYDDVGNQDPVAAAQIRADTLDEMIRTTGEAFLGLTIGCARCHHHKFDPLTQHDYYAWYATLAGVRHGERPVATAEARREHAARTAPLEAERKQLLAKQAALDKRLAERAAELEAEAARAWTRPPHSRHGTEERFPPVEARYVRLVVDGTDQPGRPAGFGIDEFEVWTAEPEPRNVALASAGGVAEGAAREARDFRGAYGAALVNNGRFGERWAAAGNELKLTLARPERIERVVFSSDRPQALGEDHAITTFVGEYRIEVSRDGVEWTEVASSRDRQPKNDTLRRARLLALATRDEDRSEQARLTRELARVDRALAAIPPLPVWWVGTRETAAGPFHVFTGGDPQKPADPVEVRSLTVFDKTARPYRLPATATEAERRLALAQWLTAADQPLVPRVLANRIWHYHFGRGLVDTPSDFGFMGGRPSHPELLDYLARQLIAGGWRLKPLHRWIVTSATYQQASADRPDARQLDGDTRLLWRYPPRRLEAEEVRDAMLFVSGRLDRRRGGPGFRLYEYMQDNVATYVPLDRHGPETYRRAVYHQNARAAPVDLMSEFDCPDNAYAAPRRSATTTPLQALTLLNHSFTLDMAAGLAERVTREVGDDRAAQVRRAFALALRREPTDAEAHAAETLVRDHGLPALARALLNASEFVFVR